MTLDVPDPEAPADSAPTRRRLMLGAATAGAAGLTVGLLGGTGSAEAAAPARKTVPETPAFGEPMIVHLRDVRKGELDLYSGERHQRVTDPDLAAALTRALG